MIYYPDKIASQSCLPIVHEIKSTGPKAGNELNHHDAPQESSLRKLTRRFQSGIHHNTDRRHEKEIHRQFIEVDRILFKWHSKSIPSQEDRSIKNAHRVTPDEIKPNVPEWWSPMKESFIA